MIKSEKEVESLKQNWLEDPCWDIEDTEGFEEYSKELLKFRLKQEKTWEEKIKQEELELYEEAEKIGFKELYVMLKEHEKLLNRHFKAIELLSNGNNHGALRVLQGYED